MDLLLNWSRLAGRVGSNLADSESLKVSFLGPFILPVASCY